MSVYKRKGSDTYSYDFKLQNRRFSGDTRATTKREAQRIEADRKDAARLEIAQEAAFYADRMTFEIAASRWFLEVGQHAKDVETVLRNLDWLKTYIGATTGLEAITDSVVAGLVARRRGETARNRKTLQLVSNATVNRTCTQPLREIIMRAKKLWKVAVGEIDFGKHMLKEPQERVREASAAEEDAILSELQRGYDAAVKFAFMTGCRRMEILGLEWTHIDFFSRRFVVTGKGDKSRTIPMSDAIYDLLWSLKDHHPTKVFTYQALKARKDLCLERGKRYPMTEAGLKTAMRRAVPNAGVKNFRFHDTRHTAATRVLRASNLRVAQKLLGHQDIATTTKYAHAMDDDIRAALNSATAKPTENPTATATPDDNDLKNLSIID
ncbi:tyrosine-type recombinase/integrase [Agrobacterium vitis]